MDGNGIRCLKIIEVCKISPSPEEDLAAPNSLPLTFFDLLRLKHQPIQQLFFYQLPSSDTHVSFLDAILPNLKTSLSLALRRYLPLVGNLLWPQHSAVPTVEFVEGDGVLLTVAESDADFHHLSGSGFREVTEYHPLVSELSMSHDRVAVMALQATAFRNRGFCIGITIHHAVTDGRTSASFVKSWTRICNDILHAVRESSIPTATELIPFYDSSVIKDPTGLTEIYANEWLNNEGPNNRSLSIKLPKTSPTLIRCTLELTPQNIHKLKQWLLKQQREMNQHISSFVAATAYLCVCTAKTEGLKDGKLILVFPADVRTRLKPPIPSNYFGNCLVPRYPLMERSEVLSENGVAVAGEAISEAIKSLEGGGLEEAQYWASALASSSNGDSAWPKGLIVIGGSPKHGVYSADFGWGKPTKVEMVSADQLAAMISLTESGNGDGGIEIGLVKEKDEMESFIALFAQGLESL
ncbi:phenolic glucoside malonyltransferase 2-like [Momordica charantia]|uniref:Phenolic glucoside malonyltransferase 2-like n=1 Tax=Momordica charantia TaxID=3673 RepID=A0A6J1D462_MOMCH|nr:phenolic glucoside malonyltransferase 2-like [Momordica charantia]XP_022148106.1 phenolic glucoside malonyltransferase 2-like [Momordica charantia]XP_022148107.1 phenolic glucoside malonyltransferase 2-like [Momordica charantia]